MIEKFKITQTMKQVTKLGVLLAIIACSMHSGRAATLQSAKKDTKLCNIPGEVQGVRGAIPLSAIKELNGAQVLEAGDCGCELPPEPEVPLSNPPSTQTLGSATIRSFGASALASQLTETNEFDDHRCAAAHCAEKCIAGSESTCAFGCGTRKRTVCLEGDICYRNIKSSCESGEAQQAKKACEETTTVTTTQLASVEGPQPCVTARVCPPE